PAGDGVEVAWNPEFLREGFAVADTLHPDRLVLGVDRDRPGRAEELAREIYAQLLGEDIPFIVTDLATAELVKTAANSFLATKISFINEIASVCEQVGADAREVEAGLKSESRIGPKAYLRPGGAFAGGTLARDVAYLVAKATETHRDVHLLGSIRTSNESHKGWAVRRLESLYPDLKGRTVAVLGLTYKPGTNTLRRSASVETCTALARAGALPAGQQVDALLPPPLRPRLAAALAAVGVADAPAQRLQPWLLGTLMTLQAARLAGFHTEQGVDLWLATLARARGLPLWSLETVERQIAALSAGGDAAQLASLVEVIELIEQQSGSRYFGAMLDAWRRGDPAALDHLLRDEMASPGMAPLLADLLDQRNAEMADVISARLQQGPRPFIAVGAGHFGGPGGLLELLAQRGWRPVQVVEGGE
uniref:TraB/GumN family protein n=1 Tax=Zoogloea sp. TaxID=49181 RepID=UPI002FDFC52E